jgi:hypothetical protein
MQPSCRRQVSLLAVLNGLIPLAQLSCGYRNGTDRMVIVRCIGPDEFFLERVVFPFELLSFLAPPGSAVEIWTHGLGGPELMESLPVEQLLLEPGQPSSPMGTGPLTLNIAPNPESNQEPADWQEAV